MDFKRRYYPIEEAAKIVNSTVEDLIHFAAHGEIKLHVLLAQGIYVNPVLLLESDQIFGDRPVGQVSGLKFNGIPVELSISDWCKYEADHENATFSELPARNFLDSGFHATPSGIVLGYWELLNSEWKKDKFKISTCKIVVMDHVIDKITQQSTQNSNQENSNARKQRIKSFVNHAYSSGRTKESAYAELAKNEGCGVDNIKRIYKS